MRVNRILSATNSIIQDIDNYLLQLRVNDNYDVKLNFPIVVESNAIGGFNTIISFKTIYNMKIDRIAAIMAKVKISPNDNKDNYIISRSVSVPITNEKLFSTLKIKLRDTIIEELENFGKK